MGFDISGLTIKSRYLIMFAVGRSGGIGRRAGFKIPSWQQGEGSIPSSGIFQEADRYKKKSKIMPKALFKFFDCWRLL